MYKIIPIIDDNGGFKFLVFSQNTLVASFMTAKSLNSFLKLLNAETIDERAELELDVALEVFKKRLKKAQK